MAKHSAEKIPFDVSQWVKIEFEETNIDVYSEVKKYANHDLVVAAQPDYIARTYLVPNDPYYVSYGSWGQDHLGYVWTSSHASE